MKPRKFSQKDGDMLVQKIFHEFDTDKSQRFSKFEFPKVLKTLVNLTGADQPCIDDVDDIFNLLDVNGDETIDKQEFKSLIRVFFKILNERNIDIVVREESDIIL